jgi:hypothetical protein
VVTFQITEYKVLMGSKDDLLSYCTCKLLFIDFLVASYWLLLAWSNSLRNPHKITLPSLRTVSTISLPTFIFAHVLYSFFKFLDFLFQRAYIITELDRSTWTQDDATVSSHAVCPKLWATERVSNCAPSKEVRTLVAQPKANGCDFEWLLYKHFLYLHRWLCQT